eukprot:scaffold22583_cov106-Cylindrotheca_fusiformis.AAC.4
MKPSYLEVLLEPAKLYDTRKKRKTQNHGFVCPSSASPEHVSAILFEVRNGESSFDVEVRKPQVITV